MNAMIETDAEFLEAIDVYGKLCEELEEKKAEAKLEKNRLELYAEKHKIKRQNAEHFRFVMKKGSAALRCQHGVTDEEVVALLKKSEIGRNYIVSTYDSVALKRDLGSSDEGLDRLTDFGLMLTEPKPHAQVEKISG